MIPKSPRILLFSMSLALMTIIISASCFNSNNIGLYVGSVTITRFENQVHAIAFQKKLENLGIKVFRHYPIAGYPNDIEKIVSDKITDE